MIREAYVSYETAKLLKEKGFDEKATHWYNVKESLINDYPVSYENFTNPEKVWLAPTHQMACAWLREVCNIDIIIFHEKLPNDCFWARIERNLFTEIQQEPEYNSYEDAMEAALKYTLENLI